MVPVYFNPESFKAICADTAKAGFRGVLLQPQKAKEKGFEGETVWQRKGIGKFLKFIWQYWRDHESDRLRKLAELQEKERALAEEKKRLVV